MIKQDIFKYTGGDDLPEDAISLSGSQINEWIYNPWNWYQSEILKDKTFKGNTSSVLGTAIHFVAEMYSKGISNIKDELFRQLDEYKIEGEELDKLEIKKQIPSMSTALINGYLNTATEALSIEEKLLFDMGNSIFVRGTTDRLEGTTDSTVLIDYKTYNSSSKPKAIPTKYKTQLLFYAWLAIKIKNYNIDRIRLVYVNRMIDKRGISEKTGKPIGKIYPSEVTVLTECITDEDLEYIEGHIMLWHKTMEFYKKNKDVENIEAILFKDPRLLKQEN